MNPNWIQLIYQTSKKASKKCPHCGKVGVYPRKKQGRFYTCKKCGHRFKEKNAKHAK